VNATPSTASAATNVVAVVGIDVGVLVVITL